MYPEIVKAQSPDIASRINGLLSETHVFIRRLYANGDVSLGLNLKAPAASFTSNCLKHI